MTRSATVTRLPGSARRPLPGISLEAVVAAQTRGRRPTEQPFSPSPAGLHPPVVTRGLAEDARLAQDDGAEFTALVGNWAQGAIYSSIAEGTTFLGYAALSVLAQRAEYRVMSEEIASEMTREWIEFKSAGDEDKSEKIKAIEEEFKRLKVREAFRKGGALYDGFFGRGHVYLDTGDTDDRDELKMPLGTGWDLLSKAKIGPGGKAGREEDQGKKLVALRPVEPVWCYPTQYDSNDPLKPDWYNPITWFVMGKEVHRTRLLTFIGREVPDLLKPAYSFGGLSMSQMAKPYVDNWLRTRQAVSDIINNFSVRVLKTGGVAAALSAGGEQIFRRAEFFNNVANNLGVMLLDLSEELSNVTTPLSGLEQLQAQSQEHMACLVAGTLVLTDRGHVPIEDVTVDDRVMTRDGWAPLAWSGRTGYVTELIELKTPSTTLVSTSWHPIFRPMTNGFVDAENVRVGDRLLEDPTWRTNTGSRSCGAAGGGVSREPVTTGTSGPAGCSTDSYGSIASDLFRTVLTFITSMATRSTTASRTWNSRAVLNITPSIWSTVGSGSTDSRPFDPRHAPSVVAPLRWLATRKRYIAATGASRPLIGAGTEYCTDPTDIPQSALSAACCSGSMSHPNDGYIAALPALTVFTPDAPVSESAATFARKCALVAARFFKSCRARNNRNVCSAPRSARSDTVVSKRIVRTDAPIPVYNLEVAEDYLPEFYANGVLVHNSVSRIPLVKLLGIQPAGLNACLVGDTVVETDVGYLPIVEVLPGHKVMTRAGWAPVAKAGCTAYATELIEIEVNKTTVRCTPNHPFWLPSINAFVPAENVRRGDFLLSRGVSKKLTSMGNLSHIAVDGGGTGEMVTTIQDRHTLRNSYFTEKFGECITDLFQKVIIFITSMEIERTTNSRIFNFLRRQSTQISTVLLLDFLCTRQLTANISAVTVGSLSWCRSPRSSYFAATGVASQTDGTTENRGLNRARSVIASCAAHLLRRKEKTLNTVPGNVQRRVRIGLPTAESTIENIQKNGLYLENNENDGTLCVVSDVRRVPASEFVYDIQVAQGYLPEFFANGICVHNSSEGEIRSFYDWIKASQEYLFRDHLHAVLGFVMLGLWGEVDREIAFDFKDLWQLDEAAKTSVEKTKTDIDDANIAMGAISAEEVRQRLAGDKDSQYAGLNLDPDELPEPPSGEEGGIPGMEGPSGGEESGGPPKTAGRVHDPHDRSESTTYRAGNVPSPTGGFGSDKAFAESEHPRDDAGKFSTSGASGLISLDREAWPEHIKNLKIPPAWHSVRVSEDPDADLLAVGMDSKDRPQYVYSARFRESQTAKKYARIKKLDEKFDSIVRQNDGNLRSSNESVREHALVMDLIMKMGLRPGSDKETGAVEKAFGATTLRSEHVVSEDGVTWLRFIGKKGVKINLQIEDPKLGSVLRERAAKGGPLFPRVSDASLRDYSNKLDGGGFKTKDFRTLRAAHVANDEIASLPTPRNETAYKKAVRRVAIAVSDRLGNTPTVALQSYIPPMLFAPWRAAAGL